MTASDTTHAHTTRGTRHIASLRRVVALLIALLTLWAVPADAAAPRRNAKKTRTTQTAAKKKQRTAGDVRRERKLTAGEIEKTQKQINENTRQTRRQLNRLASLDAEITRNEAGIADMQARVDTLDARIKALTDTIEATELQLKDMRAAYGRSLAAQRRRRSQVSPTAFVLGSRSLSEAWRRSRYLRELSEAHAGKAARVRAAAAQLAERREALADVREQQRKELGTLAAARNVLRDKQQRADTLVASLKREGASLKRALDEKRAQARRLDRELDRIIAEEARRAEEERRKAEAAEAARRKAEAEAAARQRAQQAETPAGKTDKPATPPAKTDTKPATKPATPGAGYNTAAADRALSGNFAANKGRLLFPVAGSYRIVSVFGRTKHPRIPSLEVQNSGIDIEAAGEATARAVFDGEVTSVFRIDGYQNIVILRHGEYLTVYAGLDRITVRKGDKVRTGQRLGHIYADPDDGGRAVLHFELRHERQKLNPSEWVKP